MFHFYLVLLYLLGFYGDIPELAGSIPVETGKSERDEQQSKYVIDKLIHEPSRYIIVAYVAIEKGLPGKKPHRLFV